MHEPIIESIRGLPHPSSLRKAFDQLHGVGGHSGVVLLTDNAMAWATRWEMLGDATERIDATYFIIDHDLFGQAFLGHLYERALHGVKVRLIVDGRGTGPLLAPLSGLDDMQELAATGNADIRIYNPPFNQIAQTLLQLSAVPAGAGTHEKILAVDGEIAVAGGRNIGGIYFTTPQETAHALTDADVLVDGPPVVVELQRLVDAVANAEELKPDAVNVFQRHDQLLMIYGAMDAWVRGRVPDDKDAPLALEAAGLAQLEKLPERAVRDEVRPLMAQLAQLHSIYGTVPVPDLPRHEAEVRVVSSPSRAEGHMDDAASDALLRAIGGARSHIMLQSPYFLMTPRMLAALARASRRGVEIDVLTNSPGSSDNDMSQALFIDTWPELEARVPTLRIFVAADGRMLHAKRSIFDDELSLIGSYNLDPLSAHLNSELIVCSWSRELNDVNRADLMQRLDGGDVVEYRIKRDAKGRPVRDANGVIEIEYGPRNHLTEARIEQLESLKRFLFSIRGIWDFEWVAW